MRKKHYILFLFLFLIFIPSFCDYYEHTDYANIVEGNNEKTVISADFEFVKILCMLFYSKSLSIKIKTSSITMTALDYKLYLSEKVIQLNNSYFIRMENEEEYEKYIYYLKHIAINWRR